MSYQAMFDASLSSSPPNASALVATVQQPPSLLPMVVLADLIPFPGQIVPILLHEAPRRNAVLYAKHHHGFLFFINQKNTAETSSRSGHIAMVDEFTHHSLQNRFAAEWLPTELRDETDSRGLSEASMASLHAIGVVGRLIKSVRLADGRITAFVHLMCRAQLLGLKEGFGLSFSLAKLSYPLERVGNSDQAYQAVFRQVQMMLQRFFDNHPGHSDELKLAALAIENPSLLADFIAQHLSHSHTERLAFLEETNSFNRLQRALEVLLRELELLLIGNRISQKIRDRVEKQQRDFLLREQLKAIRTELGEDKDPVALFVEQFHQKIANKVLPEEAVQRIEEELRRLQTIPLDSPEHHLTRTYLDWLAQIPWGKLSHKNIHMPAAQKILQQDHYGLEKIKERIAEFIAVQKLNPNKAGSILCLTGPCGVGKTSLGKSIARALGRKFYHFSVGGIRDEAEIKGHRRTYVGAAPGRIVTALKTVGVQNPIILLDELDKLGSDRFRGDPASALLEVLDPVQNTAFRDHYLDLPLDLSRVTFIFTANVMGDIPEALRDRLEIISIPGYLLEEKVHIFQKYLLPKQRTEHGLKAHHLRVSGAAVVKMVTAYTHEAGVRELERLGKALCRKRALQLVKTNDPGNACITTKSLVSWLGPHKFSEEQNYLRLGYGVALGLAWTPQGGEVLFVEAVQMPGKGRLKITGQLGEVMQESANIAMSFLRNLAPGFGIDDDIFFRHDFHLHFPHGAVKKDGPSAGVVATAALLSLICRCKLRSGIAMTGEMTLRGDILPVGGIAEKVAAAKRAGIKTVLLPEANRGDVFEISKKMRLGLEFVYLATFEDVLRAAFVHLPLLKATRSSKAPNNLRLTAKSQRC